MKSRLHANSLAAHEHPDALLTKMYSKPALNRVLPSSPRAVADDCSTSCSRSSEMSEVSSNPAAASSSSMDDVMRFSNDKESRILKRYNIDSARQMPGDFGPDPRDASTPDAWISGRHPDMVRLTGIHPFNSETPVEKLMESGFITKTGLHYTRNHGAVPKLSWETHKLELVGDMIEDMEMSMDDLVETFEHETVVITMCCAGNRRKEENMVSKTVGFSWNTTAHSTSAWTGVRLREVLLYAGLDWEDEEYDINQYYVWMVGADELPHGHYGTCVPLGHVMSEANDVLLAFKQNGSILQPDRGFPVRMIIPGWIGGRMVKWLKRIEIRKREPDLHYHYFDNRILPPGIDKEKADEGGWWYKPEYLFNTLNINSAITSPMHGTQINLAQPFVEFKGYAYSGGGNPITRAELSVDRKSWQLCELERTEKPNRYGMFWCWSFWKIRIPMEQIRTCKEIGIRAWDATNNTQPENITWNVMGMGNNCVFRVKVEKCRSSSGESAITFIHPTQGAGLQNSGWMSPPARESSSKKTKAGMDGLPELSWAEVRKHNSKTDAWIVVDGYVYDCSKFLASHPGGASSIYINGGLDVTDDFYAIHSKKAVKMLDEYLIGKVTGPPATVASEEKSLFLLQSHSWVPFYVKTKMNMGTSSVLLHFTPNKPETEAKQEEFGLELRKTTQRRLGLPVGHHILVRSSEDVIRPYTPIISAQESAEDFTLLVKVYPDGRMSKYLGMLKVGDKIDVKGPFGEICYEGPGLLQLEDQPLRTNKIGFICGGSGITPAFRIIDEILRNKDDATQVFLLYANSSCEDILLKSTLDEFAAKYPNFNLMYTVSSVSGQQDGPWKGSVGRITDEMVAGFFPSGHLEDCFVGLCGPPAMLEEAAIPFLEKHGYLEGMYKCF